MKKNRTNTSYSKEPGMSRLKKSERKMSEKNGVFLKKGRKKD